ncbi:hypothetical protein HU200_064555 [Digitaria exilis]|uniref:Protein LURP-one-related 5-like n=1 Tax=Digitaria exilis TaxID=1010633 RepID=A0A835A1F4_9POAL|nr:hypothetical protein HU200_064555 [Digitaria exilis]
MTPAFPDPRSSMVASRIHPTSETTPRRRAGDDAGLGLSSAALRYYTVWKRSSMGFQGTDGFSVYDAGGALVFRVDNYSRRRKIFAGELLLMDGQGSPLLTLRPQIFSMHDQWNCYTASEQVQGKRTRSHQVFSMRKCSVLLKDHEAEVSMSGCSTASDHTGHGSSFWIEGCFRRRSCKIRSSDAHDVHVPNFRVQGSFWRRSCKIRNSNGEVVARITTKKARSTSESVTLGEDVFNLTVMPNADCTMIMAFVVIMDRICQKPYKPLMCSAA